MPKPKITSKQWEEIQKRMLAGEATRQIARDYGVTEAAIRKKLGTRTKQIKAVANQIVAVEENFSALDLGSQIAASNLACELRQISAHLAKAAVYGSATAHRLFGIAHQKVQEIDDATPLSGDGINTLQGIAALTKMGNESASVGLNLLNAQKEAVKRINDEALEPERTSYTVVIKDASKS